MEARALTPLEDGLRKSFTLAGPAEAARIRAAEGHVFRGRVNGMLAVSRALGDFLYKAREGSGPEGRKRRRVFRACF